MIGKGINVKGTTKRADEIAVGDVIQTISSQTGKYKKCEKTNTMASSYFVSFIYIIGKYQNGNIAFVIGHPLVANRYPTFDNTLKVNDINGNNVSWDFSVNHTYVFEEPVTITTAANVCDGNDIYFSDRVDEVSYDWSSTIYLGENRVKSLYLGNTCVYGDEDVPREDDNHEVIPPIFDEFDYEGEVFD